MLFGVVDRMDPMNRVLNGSPDPHRKMRKFMGRVGRRNVTYIYAEFGIGAYSRTTLRRRGLLPN